MEPELHQYQNDAIDFIIENKAVFLAIDMGLGKTVITLKALEKIGRPSIVFAPIQPMYTTWPNEIEKWGIDLTFDILHNEWKDEVYENSNADILLCNYDGISWLHDKILKTKKMFGKRVLVLDESSMIKNQSTERFKKLKRMMPLWDEYRICLSATPSPNGLHELWSQYYMLDEGKTLFSSYTRYRGFYFHYSGPPAYSTTLRTGCDKDIRDSIAPITFRLKDTDYLEMPEYIHNEFSLELPSGLRKQYKELETNFFLEFDEADAGATAFNAAALSMKLRQFLQGAVYLDDMKGAFQELHKIKLDALKYFLEISNGQPILCPIQFKFELAMIKKELGNVMCISGGTSTKDAQRYIKMWDKGEIPLLLCHPASIGHGTNLQAGGHIILWYGLTWSLEQYKQLNGRLYRQGQKNAVVVHHLVMKDTIDDRIVKVLKQKDSTMTTLLDSLRRR